MIKYTDLIDKQLKNIPFDKKLSFFDIKRIDKNLNSSIFHPLDCSIWNGYITNNNNNKGIYVNFYFNKKKVALHRLLYINYVGDLFDNEYIKFSCINKGKCCNVNHMKKFSYKNIIVNNDNQIKKKIIM